MSVSSIDNTVLKWTLPAVVASLSCKNHQCVYTCLVLHVQQGLSPSCTVNSTNMFATCGSLRIDYCRARNLANSSLLHGATEAECCVKVRPVVAPINSSITPFLCLVENNRSPSQENGHVETSILHYRRAVDLKSDFSPAWLSLGVALAKLDREDEAIVAYKVSLINNTAAEPYILYRGLFSYAVLCSRPRLATWESLRSSMSVLYGKKDIRRQHTTLL